MSDQGFNDEQCPICGYYCLGKGGLGCINKPSLTGLDAELKQTGQDRQDAEIPGLVITMRLDDSTRSQNRFAEQRIMPVTELKGAASVEDAVAFYSVRMWRSIDAAIRAEGEKGE